MSAQPAEAYPTRSPYRIESDEGPQSIAELKAALAPWPEHLMAFTARLEAAEFSKLRGLIAEYRMVWLSLVHPVLREATANSQGGSAGAVPWDEVMADYDPETFELLPGARP
ncbi:hypothetical protein ACFQ2B_40595 [Streptomyces stramineus]|uniref:Uncharacterized protein n=1 Tax=Streptomyces stramineus TaxID=173861 RepID=A0ABP3JXE1_9ACTN